MIYFVWALPAAAVLAAIASGHVRILQASLMGLLLALIVALSASPQAYKLADAALSLARGAWIGWIVVPYILGGLLFWKMAIRSGDAAMPAESTLADAKARRRLLFAACFLIGPFAESATGFGVGIIGTMMLVRRLDVPPVYLLTFSLFSQTMILWGGMGSGAIVAAAFARSDPTKLALHTSFFLLAFNAGWLPIYWKAARRAGLPASGSEKMREAIWLGIALMLVIGATDLLGPEVAMLAAYAPVIVVRYLIDERPDRHELARVADRMLPFFALIVWLVLTRLYDPLQALLEQTARMEPFANAPHWSPFFHAGSWLVIAAMLTGIGRGHYRMLYTEARSTWHTGRLAVLTIISFSMMAEVISGSGIAAALADGLFGAFDRWAIVVTPMLSAIFGALANSSNAANGLFMASQVSLAEAAGIGVGVVAALQHASALSLNMISPVRMSIAQGLAGTQGLEREVYRLMAPMAGVVVLVLLVFSLGLGGAASAVPSNDLQTGQEKTMSTSGQ